jgi:DNA modification methylase
MTMKDRVKELRRVPASELRANPKNWRRHPPSQEAALRGVLEDIGFADAVIARETDDGLELIDGHLRQEVMGDQAIPVLIVDVTEEEADKMLLTLDPLAMMAHADTDQLLHLLRDTQFESKAVNDMLEAVANGERVPMPDLTEPVEDPGPEIDRADELREKWQTERGQVWEVGRHRLMCGDNDDMDAFIDTAIDFAFTSPPYNVGVEYGAASSDANTPWDEYEKRLRPIVAGIYTHMAPGRLIGWNIGTSPKTHFIQQLAMFEDCGWTYHRLMVWQKTGVPLPSWYNTVNNPVARQFTPNYTHEIVGLFCKGDLVKGGPVSFDDRLQHDVFRAHQSQSTVDLDASGGLRTGVNSGLETRARKTHPAPFPVAVPSGFIQHLSDVGAIVYDPFLGSGTTMVAAEQLGRICYGMEIEPKYVAVTLERMSGMGLEPKLVTG